MNEKTLKKIKSLSMAKYRQSLGLFVAEGPHVVESFIANRSNAAKSRLDWEIETIICTEKMIQFAVKAEKIGIKVDPVDSKIFQKISDTESPQGIMAIIKIPSGNPAKVLECDKILIADGISDPGNMGTIIRSAAAFGFAGVIASQGSADIFSPKVVRASQGAMAYLKLLNRVSNSQIKDIFKADYVIIALTASGGMELSEIALKGRKLGLIIGSEIKGISPELSELAEYKARIPILEKIESLNASIAAGIAMYHLSL